MESKNKKNRSQIKHEAIIQAAMDEFREHGFKGAKMDRVAQRAQVSKRTVYKHFESKQTLFNAIIVEWMQQSSHATSLPYCPETPLQTQLMALAQKELELLRDPQFVDFSRVAMGEFFHSPALAQQAFAEANKSGSGMSKWIQAATDDQRLRVSNIEIATTQFFAQLKAFAFWPQVVADLPALNPAEGKVIARSAVEMFLAYYEVKK